jgi:hypothetical protein
VFAAAWPSVLICIELGDIAPIEWHVQVEWIYLRNAAGQWVARRVQRHPTVEKEVQPWWKSLLEGLLDALAYMWH